MEKIIEIKKISRTFGEFKALNEVSLDIEKGTIFGLLGPNGAGKSTLIKVLSCQMQPSTGSIFISGLDVVTDKKDVLSIIGVVPQENSFYEELTVAENLKYFGSLYGIAIIDIKKRIHRILEMLQLTEKRSSRAGTLSGGMKTRLNIACALIHRPEVLILDEPSVGLDPVSRKALWDTIREVNREGTTILITTHYMEEADLLCDRILIMHRGNIIVEGTSEDLKNMVGERVIQVTSTPGDYHALTDQVDMLQGVASCTANEKGLNITLTDEQVLELVIQTLKDRGEHIINIESNRPSLENVFIHFAKEEWH